MALLGITRVRARDRARSRSCLGPPCGAPTWSARAGNVRNGTITITQQKAKTALVIPVTAALAEAINATPSEAMVFLLNEHGKAFTAKGFGKCCRPVPARRADRAVTARAAQGRLPPPRRGRVLGERDRQHQRARQPAGSGALHQGRRSSPPGAQRHSADDSNGA